MWTLKILPPMLVRSSCGKTRRRGQSTKVSNMPEGNRICVASPVTVSTPMRRVGVHAKLLVLIKAGNYYSSFSSLLSAPCTNQRLLLSSALINLIKATLIDKGEKSHLRDGRLAAPSQPHEENLGVVVRRRAAIVFLGGGLGSAGAPGPHRGGGARGGAVGGAHLAALGGVERRLKQKAKVKIAPTSNEPIDLPRLPRPTRTNPATNKQRTR